LFFEVTYESDMGVYSVDVAASVYMY